MGYLQWVKFSDAVPNDCAVYIVTYRPSGYNLDLVTTCHYICDNDGTYHFRKTDYLGKDITDQVIAWMDMPSAYTE